MERRLRHRGQDDREVEAERAEHPDQEDRPHDVRMLAQVPCRHPQRSGFAAGRWSGTKIGRPQPQQADDRSGVAGDVDREYPSGAHAGDKQGGDGRADEPGRLEHRGVQGDRGAEPAGRHDLGHERLPGRRVEGEDQPDEIAAPARSAHIPS
jgi:hypothetical protein